MKHTAELPAGVVISLHCVPSLEGRNSARKRLVCVPAAHSTTAPDAASTRRRSLADRHRELPRFLFTREESARILGMSLSHFQRHVQPYLNCVYSGQLRLYPPRELERWIAGEIQSTAPGR
jgi:hypothetical protein